MLFAFLRGEYNVHLNNLLKVALTFNRMFCGYYTSVGNKIFHNIKIKGGPNHLLIVN